MKRISLCTVCMNRLFHLRETLPANIHANRSYDNIEFVILDYNSNDGLQNWIRAKMMDYIGNGILKYFRTEDPTYFSLCHSKNMVSRLSMGDVIGIIDADNYAGKNYALWINDVFETLGDNSVVTTIRKTHIPYRDTGGKIAFHRNLFNKTRGFDETWVGYGFDDVDYVNRLEMVGGNRVFIENSDYLKCITHSHTERLMNNYLMVNVEEIYCTNFSLTDNNLDVIYILQNGKYVKTKFIYDENNKHNQFLTYGGWKIDKNHILEDRYEIQNENFILHLNDRSTLYSRISDKLVSSNNKEKIFWNAVSPDVYTVLIMQYSECIGRLKYEENSLGRTFVNPKGWGIGTAYLNFDFSNPVKIEGYV